MFIPPIPSFTIDTVDSSMTRYPDAHAVELVEKQIARQREHPHEPKPPFWAE